MHSPWINIIVLALFSCLVGKSPKIYGGMDPFLKSIMHMPWWREADRSFLLLAVADLESCQNFISV